MLSRVDQRKSPHKRFVSDRGCIENPRSTNRALLTNSSLGNKKLHESDFNSLIKSYFSNPRLAKFNRLKKIIENKLKPFLDLAKHSNQKIKSDALKDFCFEANKIARQIARLGNDRDLHADLLDLIEELYVDFVNDLQHLNHFTNGQFEFAKLTGFARSPVFVSYSLDDFIEPLDVQEIFSRVELKPASQEVLNVLQDIFSDLGINLDSTPINYALFEDFGCLQEYVYGFVYLSFVFISKESQLNLKKMFQEYFSENELVAHELAHYVLFSLDYEKYEYTDKDSFVPGLTHGQVHELIAYTAGMQFAALPVLYNLISYDIDNLDDISNSKNLAVKSLRRFLSTYKLSPEEIFSNKDIFDDPTPENFSEFVDTLKDNLGETGLEDLQEFMKKRFMSEAKSLVKTLKKNNAFGSKIVWRG
ncbi:MAG: hypothetical protein RLZZ361_1083 [Cyanobacteriota bacterium]|jgi:hypothetical protein